MDFESNPATISAAVDSVKDLAHLPVTVTPPCWLDDGPGRPDPPEPLPTPPVPPPTDTSSEPPELEPGGGGNTGGCAEFSRVTDWS